MTDHASRRTGSRWLIDASILGPTVLLTIVATVAGDRDHRRVEPTTTVPVERRLVPRPEWVWTLYTGFRHVQHDFPLVLGVVTLGTAALLAVRRETWSRRGLAMPGTAATFTVLAIAGFSVLGRVLPGRGPNTSISIGYDVVNDLEFQAPGLVIGAWTVLLIWGRWRPCRDWPEALGRVVGWGWIGTLGLLLGYALLFG